MILDLGSKKEEDLLEKLNLISGEEPQKCYQCGICTAGCPSADEMDILPNQVMMRLIEKDVSSLLDSKTIWICVSCYQCATRCPQGIDIARIMEGLRTIRLRQNYDALEIDKRENLGEYPTILLVASMRKLTP